MKQQKIQTAVERAEMAEPTNDNASLVLDPGDPLPSARMFLKRHYAAKGHRTLHHHNAEFFAWTGTHYPALDAAEIRARVYEFLDGAFRANDKGEPVPFKPTTAKVSNLLDALKAASNLPASVIAPSWLEYVPDLCPDPSEILACKNGLLHLPTLELLPPTPTYFCHNALDYPFDADALDPVNWLRFLEQLWPDDRAAVETLQEALGYCLTLDTRQQKIFLLVGPMRSGKGTIGRIATRLLGQANVCAPTLAGLGTEFGLQTLIGKQLAIISDARLGSRVDQHGITERLLSISGEDGISVPRKFLLDWTGRLPTRFLILTNELPRLADASGALAGRFIVLTLTESFFGREDPGLTERLLAELPGILNWSILGWRRLQERGHFIQPASSEDAIQELRDLGSPVGAFVRECCEIGPGLTIECDILFARWRDWCTEQGRDHPGTAQTFGRDLRAAVPGLKVSQPRDGERRFRQYEGISLR